MKNDEGLGGGSGGYESCTIDQIREMVGKDKPESMQHQANFWNSIARQHDSEAERVHAHIRQIQDNWTSKSATAATAALTSRRQGLAESAKVLRTNADAWDSMAVYVILTKHNVDQIHERWEKAREQALAAHAKKAEEHSDGDGPDPGEPPTEAELRRPFDEEARQELSSMMTVCELAFAKMEMPPEPEPAPTLDDLSGESGEDGSEDDHDERGDEDRDGEEKPPGDPEQPDPGPGPSPDPGPGPDPNPEPTPDEDEDDEEDKEGPILTDPGPGPAPSPAPAPTPSPGPGPAPGPAPVPPGPPRAPMPRTPMPPGPPRAPVPRPPMPPTGGGPRMPGRTVPPVIGGRGTPGTGNLPRSAPPRTVNGLSRPVIGGRGVKTDGRLLPPRTSGIGKDGVFGRRTGKPGQPGVRIARPKTGGEALNRSVIRGAKAAPGSLPKPPTTGRKRDEDDEAARYGDGPTTEFWSVEGATRGVITNGYNDAAPVYDPGTVVPLTGEPKPAPVHDPGPAVVTSYEPEPGEDVHDPGPVAFGSRRRPDSDWR